MEVIHCWGCERYFGKRQLKKIKVPGYPIDLFVCKWCHGTLKSGGGIPKNELVLNNDWSRTSVYSPN